MGFLSSAEAAVLAGMAVAMTPPLPPDITRWCKDNIVFDERSPFPGAFDIERQSETTQLVSGEHLKGTAFEQADYLKIGWWRKRG